ncbi:MAG TPA: SAM-dependent methyltransferase [Zoogloea sp.]|uniref:class I SAM-dependent methyltransferase n=1 Tax=Zoogloea sp. TaxID=49181 RepID=UPI002CACAC0B|nr:SAM-dependent methyltransferase [Zoogloea sp.]HMV63048.1 SAM-dependent methyltransferase [Rhodocyclaceae bacterium]HMZ75689.1 SAM-dependent methyltransferase [Rhodocyclaceae bacterium]HNA68455.1 SAM-dependent methyltransferase [Rhodocyclaceae bacterium]HNC78457.1 SAM-dependent methyltransferase [Rhodocyclaceae bacterium]HND23206.1 SAM-dependent methyltransferase [Rhodocyclaceae bacterium]
MNLPPPSPDALAQSERLVARLRDLIAREGGWISFATYMGEALYAPGLGYYSGGSRKFGPGGDFITAPELTPLFGQAVAGQLVEIMAQSAPQLIEAGAGTGLLAADLLLELEHRGALPERYAILEVSGELRSRQFDTLAEKVPHLASRVCWLDTLPEHFSGALIANEVLDVMPVHLVAWRPEGLFERGVAMDDAGRFVWADVPASGRVAEAAAALERPLPSTGEYVSELNLAGRAWIGEWAARLDKGALLLVDYGYPRAEYYLDSRSTGTLLCYYRHRAHPDPFLWPGLNDITAFVDFTAMAEAGFDAGLDVLGYTSQATLLLNCGVLECLARRAPEDSPDYIRASRAVQRLTGPHEMGELFKVIALGRGIDGPLLGFRRGDRLHTL